VRLAPEDREERLRRLIDVGRSLVSEFELDILLDRVLEAAIDLTGAKYAALGVLDESKTKLARFLTRGIDADTQELIGDPPHGRGVLGVLISDPKPLRLHRVSEHPRSYGFPVGHPSMETFLGVPIVVRGVPFGNLYLTDKEGGDFDEEDEEALVVLADWAAVAIDNARSYSHVEERRADLERAVVTLEASNEIARALAGETDIDRILELIVKRARALTHARSALVMLERDGDLVVSAVAGELGRSLLGDRLPVEGTVGGHVLRSGRPERLAEARGRLRFALSEQTDAQSGLFVPLVLRGRAIGVLAAFDRLRDGPEFSPADERLLIGFATSAAAAVATAQTAGAETMRRTIEAQEQERRRWARELHDDTLQELAALKLVLGSLRRLEDPSARSAALDEATERLTAAIGALRTLIADLRPAALDQFGLHAALEALVERVSKLDGVDVSLRFERSGSEAVRLSARVEDAAYRLVQEALANVTKHARVARAAVVVRQSPAALDLVVSDAGQGFEAAADERGYGLLGMRERIALLGGTLAIETAPGQGTVIRASIPAEAEESAGIATAV
jgi:two-component system, NarL family, sensor histidine kinase DevS